MSDPTPPAADRLDLAAAGRLVGALCRDDPSEGPEGEPAAGDLPRIGGYAAHHRIASGGGGVVYEATSPSGARVAVKLLSAPAADPEGRSHRRAWRELDLLSQLRLPALPRVLDYGVHEGRIYIVTELVDGRPLDRYCREAALGPRERADLLARIADAVQSLHEHGVIHRDLKPANILVDAAGIPFLLDLGIATLLAGGPAAAAATLSPDGAPIGTPAFMAPEQARGDRAALSTRSDVYALGATACLILTGHTPHDTAGAGSLAAAVHMVAHAPPRTLDPALPRPLAAIISRATDPDPARRYESAAAFAADLRRWTAGEPVEAQPVTGLRRLARAVVRHPVLTTAAVCLLIAGAAGGLTYLLIRAMWNTPAAAIVDPATRSRVDLLSRAGNLIHTWRGMADDTVRAVAYLDDHPVTGDLVVIAWDRTARHDNRGLLCGYEALRPREPAWTAGVGGLDLRLPTPAPDPYQNDFRAGATMAADVFDDVPGEEIIALHLHHPMSPVCIRVYDARGKVLYEVWHDGHIADVLWLPDPGLIVAAGMNADRRWSELGFADGPETWPRVLFAVRPRFGETLGFLKTPHGIGGAEPAWYKFLGPYAAAQGLRPDDTTLREPTPSLDDGRHFRAEFKGTNGDRFALTLILDEHGTIDAANSYTSDSYRDSGLPPLHEITLTDEPPTR